MNAGRLVLCAALASIGAGLFFLCRGVLMDSRATALSEQLRRLLPPSVGQWSDGIAYGAVHTAPADFPPDDEGDRLISWALFCAAVMNREQGEEGGPFRPWGEWSGEGDSGHAVTPWQLDKRYHGKFLNAHPRDELRDSEYACGLLADNWKHFRQYGGELAQAATAASYNASRAKVIAALESDPTISAADALTTGGNYGSDVLRRFGGFVS